MTSSFAGASDGRLRSRPVLHREGTAPGLRPGLHRLDDLGLGEHLLLVPDARPGPAPLLVWFHGAGGSAAQSAPGVTAAAAAHGCLVLLPTSADATWDLLRSRIGPDVAALDTALSYAFARFDVERAAFAGFSDGASYALSLGLANGDLGEAVLAFSPGFAAPPGVQGSPRCWVAHGTADVVLPVDRCGRRVVERLRRAGYEVVYEEFAGGHVVRPGDLDRALGWWLGGSGT